MRKGETAAREVIAETFGADPVTGEVVEEPHACTACGSPTIDFPLCDPCRREIAEDEPDFGGADAA